MKSIVPWLVAASLAVALAVIGGVYLARSREDEAAKRPAASAPVARTVALMRALKARRFVEACGIYHPAFWIQNGFASQDCPSVLRETFPASDALAYHLEFGRRLSTRGAVVVVDMVLGENAPLCERLWADGRRCPHGTAFRFALMRTKLLADWQLHEIAKPRERWYVAEIRWANRGPRT